jgi:Helicase associated domain
MKPTQACRLKDLEGWTWDTKRSGWENGFLYLQRYVTREGTARVPRSFIEDGFALGAWVDSARQAHKKGTLDRQFELRLESLPGWVWSAK